MKRLLSLSALALLLSIPAAAQTMTVGGRYSNYATDVETDFNDIETGRESSLGFLINYRNGALVLDGRFDHDFESGISVVDILPIDDADFSRDRFELAIGYGITDTFDVEGGMRFDNIEMSGPFSNNFFEGVDFSHQAIMVGVNVHSPTIRPVGFFASARGFIGSADFEVQNVDVSSDTNGAKLEAGLQIPVGLTGWEITPGVEWEFLETDDYGLRFDTNRFFVNFAYSFELR
jgi:hypothetical protein